VYKLKVPIVAEAKVGDNWNEMQKIAPAWYTLAVIL
jgi:hypothetical protein